MYDGAKYLPMLKKIPKKCWRLLKIGDWGKGNFLAKPEQQWDSLDQSIFIYDNGLVKVPTLLQLIIYGKI